MPQHSTQYVLPSFAIQVLGVPLELVDNWTELQVRSSDEVLGARELNAEYTIGRRIGTGSFGNVFVAKNRSGVEVAVKRIHTLASDVPTVVAEVDVMEALKHPNIVHMLDAFWTTRSRGQSELIIVEGSLCPCYSTRFLSIPLQLH